MKRLPLQSAVISALLLMALYMLMPLAWLVVASTKGNQTLYTTPGFCRERMHLFLAEDVERGEASPEEDEEMEVVRWPVTQIPERLGELEDAKTLAGLLLYLRVQPEP